MVYSFSYRKRRAPLGATVVDCRSLKNPGAALSGRADSVKQQVLADPKAARLVQRGVELVQRGEPVAFGCTFGRHRSVAIADEVARQLGTTAVHLSLEDK